VTCFLVDQVTTAVPAPELSLTCDSESGNRVRARIAAAGWLQPPAAGIVASERRGLVVFAVVPRNLLVLSS